MSVSPSEIIESNPIDGAKSDLHEEEEDEEEEEVAESGKDKLLSLFVTLK